MPHAAGRALIGMQFSYNPAFIDELDHILRLLARIIDRFFAGRDNWVQRLKM